MIIASGDFVEVELTGTLKGTGEVVDTTDAALARKHHIFNERSRYEPIVAMIGAKQLLEGIEQGLIGKGLGEHTFDLAPELAYGKKNPQLMQLVATSKFHEQKVDPKPGLHIDMDGMIGVVRTVTGGRTIVDFNHPLAGRELTYAVLVKDIVKDTPKKLQLIIERQLRIEGASIKIEGNHATIKVTKDIPKQVGEALGLKIARMLPELKKVDFLSDVKEKEAAQ